MIDRCGGTPALHSVFSPKRSRDPCFTTSRLLICPSRSATIGYCTVHLQRELEKVDEHNRSAKWRGFEKMLRRLIRDGLRLGRRPDFSPIRDVNRIHLIDLRLAELAERHCKDDTQIYHNADTRRLAKRLLKY